VSNPTNPFSWQMPTPTDLVTDLPADFEVFGQAVATSLADLLGGTSGQILAKNSNTDMDFVWIANDQGDITAVTAGTGISGGGTSGAVTITNDMATTITTNGDLLYGTGSGTYTRRGIGSSGQVLTVSGGVPTWATPAAGGGGKVLQVVNATTTTGVTSSSTTYVDTTLTATITPTLATSKILILISQQIEKATGAAGNGLNMRFFRGATQLLQHADLLYTGTNIYNVGMYSINYLDNPATTSATTYKTQFANGTAASNVAVQTGSSVSSITLLEIGA
jgi:hypothetical protein